MTGLNSSLFNNSPQSREGWENYHRGNHQHKCWLLFIQYLTTSSTRSMQPNTPEDEDTCASGRLSGRGAAAGVSIRLFSWTWIICPSFSLLQPLVPKRRLTEKRILLEHLILLLHKQLPRANKVLLHCQGRHGMVDIMFIRSVYSHHSKAEGSYVA